MKLESNYFEIPGNKCPICRTVIFVSPKTYPVRYFIVFSFFNGICLQWNEMYFFATEFLEHCLLNWILEAISNNCFFLDFIQCNTKQLDPTQLSGRVWREESRNGCRHSSWRRDLAAVCNGCDPPHAAHDVEHLRTTLQTYGILVFFFVCHILLV